MLTSTALGRVLQHGAQIRAKVRDRVLRLTQSIMFEAQCDRVAAFQPPAVAVAFRFGGPAELRAFTRQAHEYGEAEKRFGLQRLERGDSLIVGESGGFVLFWLADI